MELHRPEIDHLQDEITKAQRELGILASTHRDRAQTILEKESRKLLEAGYYPQREVEETSGGHTRRITMHLIPLGRLGEPEVRGNFRAYEPEYYANPLGQVFTCDSNLEGTLLWHTRSGADNLTTIIGVEKAMTVLRKVYDNLDPNIPPSSPL